MLVMQRHSHCNWLSALALLIQSAFATLGKLVQLVLGWFNGWFNAEAQVSQLLNHLKRGQQSMKEGRCGT